jgi:hypothetical protein
VQIAGQGDRLVAVGGGADHLDVAEETEYHGQSFSDHLLVIGDEHADRCAHAGSSSSTRKPLQVFCAVSVPPSSSARSRIPVSP